MHETSATNDTRATPPTKKPRGLIGMEPATAIETYDAVPWYRKARFALFPLFMPLLVIIALTGDVYAKARGGMKGYSEAEVWRYTGWARVFLIVVAILVTEAVARVLWR